MIEIVSKPLLVERLETGRRKLVRDFVLWIDEIVTIPAGFDTDFSSWPRFLPGPQYDKIDLAGVVHDYCCKYGTLGYGGRKIGYMESNRIWYRVARAGSKSTWFNPVRKLLGLKVVKGTRLNIAWASLGWLGLIVGSWHTWNKYRKKNMVFGDEV